MVLKSTFLLLSAASALAQESCLSNADAAACCVNGKAEGSATVGDTEFHYVCGSAPSPSKFKAEKAGNAYECAEKCANDDTCFATSWRIHGTSARGNCFFAIGENFDAREDDVFMLLAKAPEPEPNPPCLDSADANACCADGRTGGEETVGDVRFRYTCRAAPTPSRFKGHRVGSAHECAELCAQDDTCSATSWRISGSSPRGNCFFALNQEFDSQESTDQMLIAKVVDTPTPGPDPECEKEKQECLDKQTECEKENKQCQEDKDHCEDERDVYDGLHQQCETDKTRTEEAERDCNRKLNEMTDKKRECREEQQKCHEEKAEQAVQCQEDKAALALDKQHCDNQVNQLTLDGIKYQDRIHELESSVTGLENSLNSLNTTYQALVKSCQGGGSSTGCRSGIVNAEKRDDGCIIPARGKNFKIYYAKLDDPGSWDLGTPKEASYAACADRCARTTGCVRFAWHTNNAERTCWMRSYGKDKKPTRGSVWSSGQLQ